MLFRKITFIPLLFLALFSNINAQTVVLCESHDSEGKASGIFSKWDIDESGGYVYIVYNQPAPMRSGIWYLYIDRDWDNTGKYDPAETIEIKPEGKKWFVHDQLFSAAGKYRASVMRDGVEQASTYFEINIKSIETTGASGGTTTAEEEFDTYYYENSSVQFCTSVDASGNPVGVTDVFSLGSAGSATFIVYVENDGNPFKTDKMAVDIYLDGVAAVHDSYTISVEPEWDYVKFEQTLSEPGTYYFDIYTSKEVFINSGTLKIEK